MGFVGMQSFYTTFYELLTNADESISKIIYLHYIQSIYSLINRLELIFHLALPGENESG